MLPKGYMGYPRGTPPPSKIVESSTYPVFDHCKKVTFNVYFYLRRVLFKDYMGYPGGTQPQSSIVESSTFTIYVLILSSSNRAAFKISTSRSSSHPIQSFYHHSQLRQFLFESGQYRLKRIAVQSTFTLSACSSCSSRSTFKICQSHPLVPPSCTYLSTAYG